MHLRTLVLASAALVVTAFVACDSDQQVYDDTLIDWDAAFADSAGGTAGSGGASGTSGSGGLGGFGGLGAAAGAAGEAGSAN